MAVKLDPREVLTHLNQLGYENITAQQLKEFMKDLKKLIKYEHKNTENFENIPPALPYTNIIPSSIAPKISSKPKQYKGNYMSVEITSSGKPSQNNERTSKQNKSFASSTLTQSKFGTSNDRLPAHSAEAPTPANTVRTGSTSDRSSKQPKSREMQPLFVEIRPKSVDIRPKSVDLPKSCASECGKVKSKIKCHCSLKPKASYIVPRAPVKSFKSDPVALYHKYKKQWDRCKLPGETNHSELRWAIRERMLGEPNFCYR